jgi:hypothetical protein
MRKIKMSTIKFLFILLLSFQLSDVVAQGNRNDANASDSARVGGSSRRNDDSSDNNSTRPSTNTNLTGSYTIDCIINGQCTSSGDHISITDLISSTDILSWKEGHGGYAVELHGKTYLMDFVENGLEQNPFIVPYTVVDAEILRNVEAIFHNENASFKELLAKKLSEINEYSSDLAFSYMGGIMSYNWIFVDFDLKPTPDIDTIAQLPGAKYIPLANRRQQTILVNKPTWDKLDDANKVGLILHELNYSLVVPVFDRLLVTNIDMRKASLKARELTSYFFQRISQFKKIRGFNTISNNYINYSFKDKKYDLTSLIWNTDGSITLPVGKSVVRVQTQILKLDGASRPQVINWGTAELNRFDRRFDLSSVCNTSESAQGRDRNVSVNIYHSVQGNLKLKFNISEVSSLELGTTDDLRVHDTWSFSFGMNAASDCKNDIYKHVRSLNSNN